MIILKATEIQGFNLSLEDIFSEKPKEGQMGVGQIAPLPSCFRVKLILSVLLKLLRV